MTASQRRSIEDIMRRYSLTGRETDGGKWILTERHTGQEINAPLSAAHLLLFLHGYAAGYEMSTTLR